MVCILFVWAEVLAVAPKLQSHLTLYAQFWWFRWRVLEKSSHLSPKAIYRAILAYLWHAFWLTRHEVWEAPLPMLYLQEIHFYNFVPFGLHNIFFLLRMKIWVPFLIEGKINFTHPLCTACGHRMAHRKWKETKQEPSLFVAWSSCAWLQLSFFTIPVGNPMSAGCSGKFHSCACIRCRSRNRFCGVSSFEWDGRSRSPPASQLLPSSQCIYRDRSWITNGPPVWSFWHALQSFHH